MPQEKDTISSLSPVGFPERSNTHVMQAWSWRCLLINLPVYWIVRDYSGGDDYGIDAYVEITSPTKNESRKGHFDVTGDMVLFQLKCVKTIDWNADETFSFSGISTSTVNYWMNLQVPVILGITTMDGASCYIAHVKQQIRRNYSKFKNQASLSFVLNKSIVITNETAQSEFLVEYEKERMRPLLTRHLEDLLLHRDRYVDLLEGLAYYDEHLPVDLDDEMKLLHVYEALVISGKILNIPFKGPSLETCYDQDKTIFNDRFYSLHIHTIRQFVQDLLLYFSSVQQAAYELICREEKDYWITHCLPLYRLIENSESTGFSW